MSVLGKSNRVRRGAAWLEALLALAIVALLLQLFPDWGQRLMTLINVRNWSRSTWWIVNVCGAVGLIAVRFGPDLLQAMKQDWLVKQRKAHNHRRNKRGVSTDKEYERRRKFDEEWRDRAKNRLPWT